MRSRLPALPRRAGIAVLCLCGLSTTAAPGPPSPADRRAAHLAADIREAQARHALRQAEVDRQVRSAARAAAARLAAADAARAAALAGQTQDATDALRATERQAETVAGQVADIAQRRQQAQARLATTTAALAPLLPLIERLSLYPDETLLAMPGDAGDATTAILVVHGLSAGIGATLTQIRAEQAQIAALDAALADRAQALDAARARQAQARDRLAGRTALATRQAGTARADADAAAQQEAAAAARATTLRDAIDAIAESERAAQAQYARDLAAAARAHDASRLRQLRQSDAVAHAPAGPGLSNTATATGPLVASPLGTVPLVTGTVLHGWHSATDAGPAEGVTYATASQAVVTAPCQGRVEFAAPFRSYGQMLILDCGGENRFVLAGFDHIDVGPGTRVAHGQSLGRMPGWNPAGGGARPTLYVQLRAGSQTVDPSRYLGR